ncbi:MAG: hypothetical protein QXT58_04835 [Archaeoglobaceae archaeon]
MAVGEICICGFVTEKPKVIFSLSGWVEEIKGWVRDCKEKEPEGQLPAVMVLLCEDGEKIRLVHLFLNWGDEEEKEKMAEVVTSLASSLSGLMAAVFCSEVWYVEEKEDKALRVRPSLHPERKEGVLVVVWQKGKVQVHLAEIQENDDGMKGIGEWQVSEQNEEIGLWRPLWVLLNK